MAKRPEQSEIPMEGPGVSPVRYKDLDRLSDQFQDKKEERSLMSEEITKIEQLICDKMQEYGLTKYRYRDQEVIYKPGKIHIKIKTVKAEGAEANGVDDSEDVPT